MCLTATRSTKDGGIKGVLHTCKAVAGKYQACFTPTTHAIGTPLTTFNHHTGLEMTFLQLEGISHSTKWVPHLATCDRNKLDMVTTERVDQESRMTASSHTEVSSVYTYK